MGKKYTIALSDVFWELGGEKKKEARFKTRRLIIFAIATSHFLPPGSNGLTIGALFSLR